MVQVDGARGEGGGQVVRMALALATATGRSVRVVNARANRPNPGLRPQHAAVARALAEISGGTVEGAEPGSTQVSLKPGPLVGGHFEFHIATAGSIPLLVQGLLPPILASRRPHALTLTGGTDVPYAPTWDFFRHVEGHALARLGVHVEAHLERRGFYPQGGGAATVEVDPAGLAPVDFTATPGDVHATGNVFGNGLKKAVLLRAAAAARDALTPDYSVEPEVEHHRGPGRGMGVFLAASGGGAVVGADAIGRRGVSAEEVGAKAAAHLKAELKAGAPVDAHLADTLPVFLALAGGGRFRARPLSKHARTVLDLLPEFLRVKCGVDPVTDRLVEVRIEPS